MAAELDLSRALQKAFVELRAAKNDVGQFAQVMTDYQERLDKAAKLAKNATTKEHIEAVQEMTAGVDMIASFLAEAYARQSAAQSKVDELEAMDAKLARTAAEEEGQIAAAERDRQRSAAAERERLMAAAEQEEKQCEEDFALAKRFEAEENARVAQIRCDAQLAARAREDAERCAKDAMIAQLIQRDEEERAKQFPI
jgi:hypothetical protein